VSNILKILRMRIAAVIENSSCIFLLKKKLKKGVGFL